MLYHIHELQQAAMVPMRMSADFARNLFRNPYFPLTHTPMGNTAAAMADFMYRTTKRFGKPEFGLNHTLIDGKRIPVVEETVAEKPFCNLIHFWRQTKRKDPKVLIVAPMSGHYATLLRGTVEAMLPNHNVYITDWLDARQVPLRDGSFSLDDYIDYLIDFIRILGGDVHVIAVCQPAVPVMAAVSIMAADNDPKQALSMTLMGGPIDTRISPTAVTQLAEQKPISWFENTVVTTVPAFYPGAFRRVYPGFIQLTGFMSMNLDRHIGEHVKLFEHLVRGDGESVDSHEKFYNEYLAVMDMPAEFYLQTVETVFQKHSLPKGEMTSRGRLVDPSKIKKTALLTIEGELDDISAQGQTEAAQGLCSGLPKTMKHHHLQKSVGHYGIFNGRRWRNFIMPVVRDFMRSHDKQDFYSPVTYSDEEQYVRKHGKLPPKTESQND